MENFAKMTEEKLLTKLSWLLSKFVYYKKKSKPKKKVRNSRSILNARRMNPMAISTCIFGNEMKKNVFMNMSPTESKKNMTMMIGSPMEPVKTHSVYPLEVYDYLNDWFRQMYTDSLGIGGSKLKNKQRFVHLSNIKQFFLSCGLNSRKIYAKICSMFKGVNWVENTKFNFAVDKLKLATKKRGIKSAGYLIKKHIFELIFFFKLYQTYDESLLSFGEVEKVLRLALRACPDLLPSSTLHALFKVSTSSLIGFKEFFKFILSYL